MTRHPNNYLLQEKKIALIVLVSISAFAVLYSPIRDTLTRALYYVTPGIWYIGEKTKSSIGFVLANFRDSGTLVDENIILNEAIELMHTQVLDRNLLAEKVIRLEEALGRLRMDDRVVASVLAGPGRSPYDTLVIDAGENEGINVNNYVTYAGSGVIGKIIETTGNSSKVKLFSYPNEEHAVLVGDSYIPAVAVGTGMGNFEAKVPQESSVEIGDNIITAKGDFILGTVFIIEEKLSEPFKRLLFRLPFNISQIRSVEVIIN
ncbi:MAG: hypothetical protein COV32_00690 [Candidatus Yonathbacteria bacterium CG10_big_fil_rev_8_21_14_0_10_43_136]|uniref:Cell shape-determining protein MreC n=2 Tax=Parcubacteria group TaxID=1794811 RepID=A0A2M7Q5A7_9BACT|nr:MAG: hypothetical protein AUK15_01480 [Candidatus Nomurabacteria bacterium CG2_30_43_9]PIQ35687.1 MAG: hypothetical protein COW60_02665 [Candidatus Yonathbacteria bacterium CG17_big_fil_post_rev_8_21_14_2_50_43_9]PIR40951.1 MAG: hypothetical protein COV32_00690 [Candidatus Yonathbacteria bacterium CG10_big_fil_rev_8_21_14_0_10_43_136]PIX57403.1 MAG: hypothetical protein COZ48_00945 [Candidatus Yonathbacteria bacterium CG_4_10_14_3_um_filter_43_12]PIY58255.1 MAG: hypothetical protein COY98_02